MAIFEELGSERDKANVMCLEAGLSFSRARINISDYTLLCCIILYYII